MFIRRSVNRNRFRKAIFITITVLIAIGLVIPLAGLFQKQPGNSGSQSAAPVAGQSVQDQLANLESKAKDNPRDTSVLMELAETYQRVGKPDQAIKTFEQVLALDANNTQARYEMAFIYYLTNKSDQAITQLTEIIKVDPDNKDAHYLYGIVLGKGKGDYAAGIQELEKYIAIVKEGTDAEKARQTINEWKSAQAQK
ncbi:MAG: Outer membrane protein assembly factor BamD [Pelotomaculum sp. PtaU1.Bin035]|nr:MAG: Outer membrane protein assembly factor BamD [Pelotomaculum sp. PtaU1.Bin035]